MMTTASTAATRPANPKARLVMEAALGLFLEQGYDAVSTDLIAKTAGVSKATLYAHFTNKEKLFAEILSAQCADFSNRLAIPETFEQDLVGTLRGFACNFVRVFLDEHSLALYRLLVAEAHRFPEIGRIFETTGPADIDQRLIRLLEDMTAKGVLRIDDVERAAEHLTSLVLGNLPFDRPLGLPSPPPEEIDRQIDAAIWLFLKGYGTAPTPDPPRS